VTEGGGARRERVLDLLVGRGEGGFGTKRLCQVCAEATAMSGAGIMLRSVVRFHLAPPNQTGRFGWMTCDFCLPAGRRHSTESDHRPP
jgi:hypothetical protein